jgi:hypothetical protein
MRQNAVLEALVVARAKAEWIGAGRQVERSQGLCLLWQVDYTIFLQVRHRQRAQLDSIPSQDL